ncbi:MAG: hypothetical protein ACPLPS_06035 [bacterium]
MIMLRSQEKCFKNGFLFSFLLFSLFSASSIAKMIWKDDFEKGSLDERKFYFVKTDPSSKAEVVRFPQKGYVLHIAGKTNTEVYTRISTGGGAPFKLTFSFYLPSTENYGYAGVVHQPGCTPTQSFWWLEFKPPSVNLWTTYKGEWSSRWSANCIECDKWYKAEIEDTAGYLLVSIYYEGRLLAKSDEIPYDTGFSGFGGQISFGAHTGSGLQGVYYDDIVIEYTSPPPAYTLPPDYKSKAPRFNLKGQKIKAEISKDRGWLLSLKTGENFDLFEGGIGVMNIENVSIGKRYRDSDFSISFSPRHSTNSANLRQVSADKVFELSTNYNVKNDAFVWTTTINCGYKEPQEGKIIFQFPLPRWCEEIFLPMLAAPFRREEVPPYCVYRGGMCIPMATLYSPKKDIGITILADPYSPKPALAFAFNPEGNPPALQVQWQNLRLQEGHKLRLRLYLAVHPGDWRCGLKWLINNFPNFFQPENKVAPGHQLIMWELPEERIKWLREMGFTWGMSHLLKTPFYGKYFSEVNTAEEIAGKRAFLDLCHREGLRFYYYWSYIETEPSFAKSNFPDSIACTKDGRPMLFGWGGFAWMVPYPGGKWHSYILDQLDHILQALPNIDGIFVDNTGGNFVSYAQDDGITYINGHSAYQYVFAQHNILREVKERLNKLGKGVWANGSADLESARYMDGIMVESRADFLEAQKYLGLLKPMVFITYYNKHDPERQERLLSNLKSALLAGVMLGFNEWELVPDVIDLELLQKWLPLFEPLRDREWVLEAHCLTLPKGVRGNIFRTAKGDYYLPLQVESDKVGRDFTIVINVPDGRKIRSAKLYTPEIGRWARVDLRREGSRIKVELKDLKEVGGLLLEH